MRLRTHMYQRGMSMIEMMVSLTIGLVIMGAVGAIYVGTVVGSRTTSMDDEINQNATLAMSILKADIALAGYSASALTDIKNNVYERVFSSKALMACNGGFTDPKLGFDQLTCDNQSSDAIAIRYQANLNNTQPSSEEPTACNYNKLVKDANNVYTADNRYFLKITNSVSELWCQNGSTTQSSALVQNIQDMQIRLAVSKSVLAGNPPSHQIVAYLDLGSLPTDFDWTRVMGVQICLLVRSSGKSPQLKDTAPTAQTTYPELNYYDCNGNKVTNTDGKVYRTFTTRTMLTSLRPALPATYESGQDPWRDL